MAAGTISTPLDLINLSLKTAGVIGVGQTADAEDTNDAFNILNLILTEWQLNRWFVYDLLDVSHASTGAISYTVGPGGTFNFSNQRPDKIDAVYAVDGSGNSWYVYPFMSREGYDRVINKTATGVPESFFYDPGATGTVYFSPVPDNTYTLHVQAKASLGQFTSLTQSINLPQIYTTALFWNLAAQLRPLYQLPLDPKVEQRAVATLQALTNSIGQVPQAVQATPSNRAGIYSNNSGQATQ